MPLLRAAIHSLPLTRWWSFCQSRMATMPKQIPRLTIMMKMTLNAIQMFWKWSRNVSSIDMPMYTKQIISASNIIMFSVKPIFLKVSVLMLNLL